MVCATATHVVDETVLGGVVFGLEGTEERLLSAQDLDGTRRMLRQAQQAAGVADQPRADELADKCCQVGRNGVHAVAEVFGELRAVCRDRDDLVAERVYVVYIGVGDFSTHRDLCGSLNGRLEILGEDGGEVSCRSGCSEAW